MTGGMVSDTYWEFRRSVIARGAVVVDDRDCSMVELIISELFSRGWSASDAASYLRATEYVSPDLDEGIALARMAVIKLKYEK